MKGHSQETTHRSRSILTAGFAFFAIAALLVSTVYAGTTDRIFHLGDDDGASEGGAVSDSVNVDPVTTAVGFDYDLQADSATFTSTADRPFAAAGEWGIAFDGTSDRLYTSVLNNPQETMGPTPVDIDFQGTPGTSGPFVSTVRNYDNVRGRGFQFYAQPDPAGNGGGVQDVVVDGAEMGVFITAGGNWGSKWDPGFPPGGNNFDTGVPALGGVGAISNGWYHLMHVAGLDDIAGGTSKSGTALFVNGSIVWYTTDNNYDDFGDSYVDPPDSTGLDLGYIEFEAFSVGATPDGNAAPTNYYKGKVDELSLFVFGDSSASAGSPAGEDYGGFVVWSDNDFIADSITLGAGGLPNGDITGNGGDPDQGDIDAFVAGWLSDNGYPLGDLASYGKGDMDFDGDTDLTDAYLLHEQLVAVGGPSLFGALGVPEPSSIALLLLGSIALIGRRRRS